MVVKVNNEVLMTATNVPAPACGEMFVGLGAWNSRVDYRGMSVSAVVRKRENKKREGDCTNKIPVLVSGRER